MIDHSAPLRMRRVCLHKCSASRTPFNVFEEDFT
jgi:hypothetical protein